LQTCFGADESLENRSGRPHAKMGALTREKRTGLVADYDEATAEFLEAIREVQRKLGTSQRKEYERLDRVANEARVRSEHARLAVEQHIPAHRSGEEAPPSARSPVPAINAGGSLQRQSSDQFVSRR
jgi:hypothetical protein